MAVPGTVIAEWLIDPATDAYKELIRRSWRYAQVIEIPAPGQLIEAYLQRRFTVDKLTELLKHHGIASQQATWEVGTYAQKFAGLWDQAIATGHAIPTEDQAGDWLARGLIDENAYRLVLDRRKWFSPTWRTALAETVYDVPGLVDAQQLLWRGSISVDQYQRIVASNHVHPDYQAGYQQLAQQLPGPSDLVSFAVRDVWDAQALTKFGYNDEYPVQAEKWLAKQGLVYQTDNPVWADAGLPDFNWMRAYWCAHWQLPSPQQGISMLQRLRPSLKDPTVPRDPSGETFSFDELKLLIKTADYPPYWRGKLAAIGYNPIGIRFLRALWSAGLIDPIGATELFLDQGYNLRDAQLQTNLLTKQYGATQLVSCRKTSARTVLKAYQIGVVSRDQAAVQMYPLLQERQDQIDRFNALPADLQIAAATTSGLVQCLLSNQDLTYSVGRIAHKIQMIKHAYLKGAITKLDARARLNALGIDATRLNDYLDDWELELLVPKKEETTGQILRWYGIGMLDGDQAEQRLAHLGYPADVIDTMLTEASLKSIAGRIRAVQANAKHVQGEIKVAEAAAKSAAQARKDAQATLRTSASLGKLVSWLKEGLISPPAFVRRAILLGVSPADAQIYAQEVADALARQTAKAVAQASAKAQRTKPGHKQPSAAQLVKWAKKGLITRKTAASRLSDLGYSAADAEDLLAAGGV